MQVQSTGFFSIRRGMGGAGDEGLVSAMWKPGLQQARLTKVARHTPRINDTHKQKIKMWWTVAMARNSPRMSSQCRGGERRRRRAPGRQSGSQCHRSHFGSRYKLGCCGHAGLFERGFKSGHGQFPRRICVWHAGQTPFSLTAIPRRMHRISSDLRS